MLKVGPLQHKATQSFCSLYQMKEKNLDPEQSQKQQKTSLESNRTALQICASIIFIQVPHNIYITRSAHVAKYHDLSQTQIMKGELQCDPITLIQHISYCQGVGSNPKPPMNQTTLLEAAQVPPQEVPGNAVQAVSSSILAFRNSTPSCPHLFFKRQRGTGNNLAQKCCCHNQQFSLCLSHKQTFQNQALLLRMKE